MSTTLNLGRIMPINKGSYASSTSYGVLDVVEHNGSSYWCKASCQGVEPPNASYWVLMASKGADGTNGQDGSDGIDAYQPFKGWFDSSSALSTNFPSPAVGDYAYVVGATSSDPVSVYKCSVAGTWADSGSEFNPANNQSFQTGQDLDQTKIVNDLTTGGANHVLSAEAGKTLKSGLDALGPKIDGYIRTQKIWVDSSETNTSSTDTTSEGTYRAHTRLGTNGAESYASSYAEASTHFVEIGDGITFTCAAPSSTSYAAYCLYDANKTFLGYSRETGSITLYGGGDAKYVKWCGGSTLNNAKLYTRHTITGERITSVENRVTTLEQLPARVSAVENTAGYVESSVRPAMTDYTESSATNTSSSDTTSEDTYRAHTLLGFDGEESYSTSYAESSTHFIEIGDGVKFTCALPSYSQHATYCLYDANKTFISYSRNAGEITLYGGGAAKYVKWCGGSTLSNVSSYTRLTANQVLPAIKAAVGVAASSTQIYSGGKTVTAAYQNLKIQETATQGDKIHVDVVTDGFSRLDFRARINGSTKTLFSISNANKSFDWVATANVEYFVVVCSSVTDESSTYSISISRVASATGMHLAIEDIKARLDNVEEKQENIVIPNSAQYESLLGSNGFIAHANTFVDGETIDATDFPYCNKVGNQFAFNAKITSFGKIRICQGFQTAYAVWLLIDGTNIDLLKYAGASRIARAAHGLTFSDFISININIDDNGHALVSVMTASGGFDYTFEDWGTQSCGLIQVRNDGSSLTDVTFVATNKYFSSPFWIFGASQEGMGSTRWLGQLRNLGYKNFLANAQPGRDSVGILTDLRRALNFGCPKYVYFALSNDGYTASTYTARMNAAKALADEYNFEVIFVAKGVTPAETATAEAQLAKRNAVVNFGVRFFDFGKAVAQDPTDPSTIYSGWLDSEYVHPATAQCAKALALRFLVDVPEVMQY